MDQSSSEFAALLASTPDLRNIPTTQARFVVAMRGAIIAQKKQENLKSLLAQQLGGLENGHRFARIIEAMDDCWPEPIMVHQPCCHQTTYDEMMLLDLITAIVQGEPAHFYGLLCDMISKRDCDRLHAAVVQFVSRYQSPPLHY